ncbi:hypothetical protein [Williamsia sterculiae]|uniref:DUF8129 domain-containing protein n=1 Tax=Williamsia sterculiae TaxID=1344003 RepID=A0A1N7H5X3_9NOCA|nr:hypothetical protein [Williamsia sterculiae]SIS20110.1 hypothetical protein SAMN05445060_3543 [Williamsia sterculiae]
MTVSTTAIPGQLRALLALTNSEIQVAETRTAQARTEAVRRELVQNAANARARAEAINEALRDQGVLREVIRPAVGRLVGVGKLVAEQAQPLDEAILGDLALEHQLLDRSRYLKALAVAEEHTGVVDLADRLITAHAATVEWLTTVLAEEALGGPVALRRSPTQWGAGVAVRAATLPAWIAARGVDQLVDTVRRVPSTVAAVRGRAQEVGTGVVDSTRTQAENAVDTIAATVDSAVETGKERVAAVTDAVGSTVDTAVETGKERVAAVTDAVGSTVDDAVATLENSVTAGREAALDAAESTARDSGATGLAEAVRSLRESTGTVTAEQLPIGDYDSLNVGEVVAAIRDIEDARDIRVVVAYEEAHKDRQGVISAAQTRLAAIAQEVVGLN